MPEFIVILQGTGLPDLDGSYLKGPETPQKVKALGYSFTRDLSEAWPFVNEKQASHKARIIARHMSAHAIAAPKPSH